MNNLVTAINLLAVSEGLAIGKRQGLDPAVMTDVLNASTGMSWVSQTHIRQRVISRSFDDPFKLALMLKDIGIAMELARAEQLPTPLSALGQQLWRAAALCSRLPTTSSPSATCDCATIRASGITWPQHWVSVHRTSC